MKLTTEEIKIIVEELSGWMDPDSVEALVTRKRRVSRIIDLATKAAKDARKQGNEELARELEARALELDAWLHNTENKETNKGNSQENTDEKEGSESENGSEKGSEGKEESGSENSSKNQESSEGKDGSKSENSAENQKSSDNQDNNSNDNSKNGGKNSDNTDAQDSRTSKSNSSKGGGETGSKAKSGGTGSPQNGEKSPERSNGSNKDKPDNPFGLEPRFNSPEKQQQKKNNKSDNSSNDDNDEFNRIKETLKQLKHGEKDGAKQALRDILSHSVKTTDTTLTEALDLSQSIEDIDDEALEDIINDTLTLVKRVTPLINSETVSARVDKIQRDSKDVKIKDAVKQDWRDNTADERRIEREREEKSRQQQLTNSGNIDELKISLLDTIQRQVKKRDEDDEDTYANLNRRHNAVTQKLYGDGAVVPGSQKVDTLIKDHAVTLQLYLDCSSSFTPSDIEKEENLVEILKSIENTGDLIIYPPVYFADHIHSSFAAARAEGGTSAWNEMVDDMNKKQPDNILIVTDNDMNGIASYSSNTYVAQGKVWYLWKDTASPKMLDRVFGILGTEEYWLGNRD